MTKSVQHENNSKGKTSTELRFKYLFHNNDWHQSIWKAGTDPTKGLMNSTSKEKNSGYIYL